MHTISRTLPSRGYRALCLMVTILCTALMLGTQSSTALASVNNDSRGREPTGLLVWSRYDPAAGSVRLIVGRPDGSHAHDLTRPAAGVSTGDAVRSPDGRSVVFNVESADSVGIGMVDVTRPKSFRIIDTGCSQIPNCASDYAPSFTRDGRLAFTRVLGPFDPVTGDAASAALYLSDIDGSNVRRLSSDRLPPGAEDAGARYSPDGTFIVFVRDQRIDGVLHFAVHRMNPDGSDVRRLTPWSLDTIEPSISPRLHGPTAGLVVFETHFTAAPPIRSDIVTIPADCSTVRACTKAMRYVTHNAGTETSSYDPSWSPNGHRIAFSQASSGATTAIWAAKWNGAGLHRVTHGGDPEFSPAWTY